MTKRSVPILIALFCSASLAACSGHRSHVRVATVESVTVQKTGSDGALSIVVTGEAPTGGWTDIRLRRLKDKTATKDILTYDLVGRSPARTKSHDMTQRDQPQKVSASLVITKYYSGARLVQVSGGNNDVAEPIPGAAPIRSRGNLRETKGR